MNVKSVGVVLLCIYLFLVGAIAFGVAIPAIIVGIVAILAGLLILLGK